MKKLMIYLPLIAVCVCILGSGKFVEGAAAQEDTALTKSSLAMYPDMTKKVKAVNIAMDVEWDSSNNKIAEVLGSKGKYNQNVTVRSKEKTGTCKIRANVSGKTYACKVTVKKDDNVSRAKLVKVTTTSEEISVKIKLYNKTAHKMYYGRPYVVEKFEEGSWKKVAPADDIAFNDIAIMIPANSSTTEVYTIARGSETKQYTEGTYRLKVDAYEKKACNYVLFTIN